MSADGADAPRFHRLIPSREGEPLSAPEALEGWRGQGAQGSARVALNMIVSLDGRTAIDGRSAPLSSPADRALFHALRAEADAVMVGGGTVRTERYGPIIPAARTRELRAARGLSEQPLAVIVSRRLDFDATVPLLADPGSHVVIITPTPQDLPPCAAAVDYVRAPTLREGLAAPVDPVEAVGWDGDALEAQCFGFLAARVAAGLHASLAGEDLIDELFLTLAPILVGDTPGGKSLLDGHALSEPDRLELRMLLETDSQLYARYVKRSEPSDQGA